MDAHPSTVVKLDAMPRTDHPIMVVAFGMGTQEGEPICGYKFNHDPADDWKFSNYTGVIFFNN